MSSSPTFQTATKPTSTSIIQHAGHGTLDSGWFLIPDAEGKDMAIGEEGNSGDATGDGAGGTSQQSQTLMSLHKDFVHSIAFNHYGRRFATCSGDRTVRVWDLTDSGEWSAAPGSEWQAHRGSVTEVSWAHPEFGQLLATAGSDHAATVWEERVGGLGLPGSQGGGIADVPGGAQQGGGGGGSRWISRAQLTEARKCVTCVQFAPRHLGLKLATGSADGVVRIYEAIDVMNLNHWPMNGSIEAEKGAELGINSLSWCGGRFEPPTLAVGGSSGAASVYRYSDAARAWTLVASLPRHERGVLDVAWAPNVGRSYHLIATCGHDNVLRVHRLKRGTSAEKGSDTLEQESSQVLDTGGAEVWRCEWNVTGTVLASSGDGGVVQLWKSDYHKNWSCVSEVHGDVSGRGATAPVAANQ